MTISLSITLIMYAVTCICTCDFTKLTISHIYMCIYFYDKKICNKSSYVHEIRLSVCLSVCPLNINCDNPSVVDLGFFYMALFCSGFTNNIIFNKNKKRQPL